MGIFYEHIKNDDEALKLLNTSRGLYTWDCYFKFPHHYDPESKEPFYHAFFADPKIEKLVDEINSNFSNIKITIIGKRELPYHELIYNRQDAYYTYMFKIEFADGYSAQSKFVLQLTLGQFLRGLSNQYEIHKRTCKIESNFIDEMLKAHDSTLYGAWMCSSNCGIYTCSRETFNSFDNIELINENTKWQDFHAMPKISNFVDILEGRENAKNITDDDYEDEDDDYDEDWD